jgi:hypothetical protein
VVEILIARAQGAHPLADELTQPAFDETRIAVVDELLGKPLDCPAASSLVT